MMERVKKIFSFSFAVLGIKARASHSVGKHSAAELCTAQCQDLDVADQMIFQKARDTVTTVIVAFQWFTSSLYGRKHFTEAQPVEK